MAQSRRTQAAVSLAAALLLLLLWRSADREPPEARTEPPVRADPPFVSRTYDRSDAPGPVAREDRWDDRLPRPLRAQAFALSNGLTVWIVPDPSEPVVAARVAVRAGSADDPPDQLGLAHLVEHLIFQGTDRLGALDWRAERPLLADQRELTALLATAEDPEERRELTALLADVHAEASGYASPNELMRLFDRLGATGVNATTSPEVTSYQATLPPHALAGWGEAVAEALARPVFRGFAPERVVVEHEADLRDACGLRRTHHGLLAAMYGDHPYGRPVGGTAETRARIDLDAAVAFHDRFYRPNNAVVVLVGDVEPAEVVQTLERAFAGWRGTTSVRPIPRPRSATPARTVEGSPWFAWPVPEEVPREVLRVLVTAIRTEATGAPGLREVSASVTRWTGGSALRVSAACEDSVSDEACADALLSAVERARSRLGALATIHRAARGAWVEELRRLESPAAQADELVETWSRGEPIEAAWAWRSRIREVSAEALADLAWLSLDAFAPAEMVSPPRRRIHRGPTTVSDGTLSPFSEALLARVPPPSERAWRTPGVHWTVSVDGSVVASPNVRNTLFEAELIWPVGWRDALSICHVLANFRKGLQDELGGRGITVADGACAWDHTTLVVRGPEEYAAWALARVSAAVATSPVPMPLAPDSRLGADPLLSVLLRPSGWSEPVSAAMAGRPRVAYSGRASADEVARWAGAGAHDGRAPWPAVEPSALRVVERRDGEVVAVRIGEPYDPEHEALYALYEHWLTGGAGAVFEQVRTRDAGAYGVRSEYRRGRWPGDPNLTIVSISSKGDWVEVAYGVGAVLTTRFLPSERWEALRAATAVELQTEVIPFRGLSAAAWAWMDRGLPTDGRRVAFALLDEADAAAFDAFLAAEADRPIRWLIRAPGAAQADWTGLPR